MAAATELLLYLYVFLTGGVGIPPLLRGVHAQEAPLFGKFQLSSDPADSVALDCIRAMGYSETFVEMSSKNRPITEISWNGDYTIMQEVGSSTSKNTFESGKPFDGKLVDGRMCKHVYIMEPSRYQLNIDCPAGDKGTAKQVAEFTWTGFVLTTTLPGGKSMVQTFKRP